MKQNRIPKYVDYPSLAFRMIIIFGMYMALQSGIAINPHPATPLRCVVIPQFSGEGAQAERVTPERAKACRGTAPSVLPRCDFGWSRWAGKLRSSAGRGFGRCSEMGSGRGKGAESILTSWQRHREHTTRGKPSSSFAGCIMQLRSSSQIHYHPKHIHACMWAEELIPKLL